MTNHTKAPKAVRRSRAAEGGPLVSCANNGARTDPWGTLLMACRSLVVVVVALFASVLVPAVVSAHDPEEVPLTVNREEPVYNYEDQQVRVAPFSEVRTIDVFNYETQPVRVAPFTTTRRVDVYNYETQPVRVAPFTTIRRVDVFNYETQPVRVAPFTKSFTSQLYFYETRRVRVAPFWETKTVDVYNYRTIKSSCRPPRGCVYTKVRVVPFTKSFTSQLYFYETRRVRVAPFWETTTVDVFNFEDQQVRVAPFTTTKRVDVFNYETRPVRVAPFWETTTVDVFNYEDQQVRVAPFTTTIRVDVFNYETRPVRVAPFTRTVTYTDPTKTVSRHDASEHTCPDGQRVPPLPEAWAFKVVDETLYMLNKPAGAHLRVREWEMTDTHTNCHQPKDPFIREEETTPGSWINSLQSLVASWSGAETAVRNITIRMRDLQPSLYDVLYFTTCNIGAIVSFVAGAVVGSATWIQMTEKAGELLEDFKKKVKKFAIVGGIAGIAVAVIETAFCNWGIEPDYDDTTATTTTTTTTTLPPTTTTTTTTTLPPELVTPPSLPVVSRLPAWDRSRYRPKTFSNLSAVPESCTPWVTWRVRLGMTLLVALCRR